MPSKQLFLATCLPSFSANARSTAETALTTTKVGSPEHVGAKLLYQHRGTSLARLCIFHVKAVAIQAVDSVIGDTQLCFPYPPETGLGVSNVPEPGGDGADSKHITVAGLSWG